MIALFYFYHEIAFKVFVLSFLITNVMVWIGARASYHIGASGLIYSFASFLFFSGILRRYTQQYILLRRRRRLRIAGDAELRSRPWVASGRRRATRDGRTAARRRGAAGAGCSTTRVPSVLQGRPPCAGLPARRAPRAPCFDARIVEQVVELVQFEGRGHELHRLDERAAPAGGDHGAAVSSRSMARARHGAHVVGGASSARWRAGRRRGTGRRDCAAQDVDELQVGGSSDDGRWGQPRVPSCRSPPHAAGILIARRRVLSPAQC